MTSTAGTATTTVTPLNLAVALQQAGSAGTVNAAATYQGVTVTAQSYFTLGTTAISLALNTPSSGSATVSSYGTSVIAVQVNSSSGVAFTQLPVTVNFSSGCQQSGKATLPKTATTVSGIATVTYTDLGCGVNDTVTATTAGSSSTVSVKLAVTAPQTNSIYFVSATPTTIAIPASGGIDTTLLTFTVTDTNGNPKQGVLVEFGNTSTSVATLTTSSATSDSNGQVTAAVTAGTTPGTFRVTALVHGTSISTISGNVIVSQNIPVVGSFTVAPVTYNMEGLNFVQTDKITAYLADINGNYVADGTPVLATTQGGAIGLNGKSGGCFTVSGNCTLTFTSQYPIPSTGLAVVQFSSSTGASQLVPDPIQIILSGSDPYMFVPGLSTFVPVPSLPSTSVTNITNADCSGNIGVVITDINGNPLPVGTAVSVSSSYTNVSAGTIIPASVPNTPPVPKASGNPGIFATGTGALLNQKPYIQGTVVTLQIVISGQNPVGSTGLAAVCAKDTGSNTATATLPLTVKVQTPLGSARSFNLTLTYPVGP